jgi:hypothetical protein
MIAVVRCKMEANMWQELCLGLTSMVALFKLERSLISKASQDILCSNFVPSSKDYFRRKKKPFGPEHNLLSYLSSALSRLCLGICTLRAKNRNDRTGARFWEWELPLGTN